MEKGSQGRILDLNKFRVRQKIENCGLEWREDDQGKVKIWIKMGEMSREPKTIDNTLEYKTKGKLIHLHYLT